MSDSLKACHRKIGYTKAEAKLQQKVRKKGFKGSIYRCDNCYKYHLTSQSNGIPRRVWESIGAKV